MHRVLKFIAHPNEVDLTQLGNSITKEMFKEIDKLKDLV